MCSDQDTRRQKEVEVRGIQTIWLGGLSCEPDPAYHQEEAVPVLLDLDTATWGPDIFDCKWVEAEEIGQESVLIVVPGIQVYPEWACSPFDEFR